MLLHLFTFHPQYVNTSALPIYRQGFNASNSKCWGLPPTRGTLWCKPQRVPYFKPHHSCGLCLPTCFAQPLHGRRVTMLDPTMSAHNLIVLGMIPGVRCESPALYPKNPLHRLSKFCQYWMF